MRRGKCRCDKQQLHHPRFHTFPLLRQPTQMICKCVKSQRTTIWRGRAKARRGKCRGAGLLCLVEVSDTRQVCATLFSTARYECVNKPFWVGEWCKGGGSCMIYACEGRFKFKFSSSKINIAQSLSIKTEDVARRGRGTGTEMLSAVTDDSDMAGISFSLPSSLSSLSHPSSISLPLSLFLFLGMWRSA